MLIPEEVLRSLCDRESLFHVLERYGWRVSAEDTFTYDVPLAGAARLPQVAVSQIPPFAADDPYTLILVEFASEFRRTDLRDILREIRREVREKGRFSRVVDGKTAAPQLEDIIFVCTTAGYKGVRFAHFEQRDDKRQPRLRVFGWDCDQKMGMATLRRINMEMLRLPRSADGAPDWARAHWMEAWNVEAVTKDFYDEYEGVFHRVEAQIQGSVTDKREFTQRLFNRLFFIRFLEMKGWLKFRDAEGRERTDYLRALFEAAAQENFFRDRLYWAFFSGLGTSDNPDIAAVEALRARRGQVPYLNGGLFEMEADDVRDAVQIGNAAFADILNLFDAYNFTITESAPDDVEVAVDPEMLGKVFEKLVTKGERQSSGSYYTPRTVVSFMCREALKGYLGGYEALIDRGEDADITLPVARDLLRKLAEVRVVDPACGSGAYLLGMLRELFTLNRLLDVRAERPDARGDYARKLTIIQDNLYGVDKSAFAVQIARLRLWLSLIVEFDDQDNPPPPLPNLDFKIEAGDSLTAPNPELAPNLLRHGETEEFGRLKNQFMRVHERTAKQALLNRIDPLRAEIRQGTHSGVTVEGFDWRVEFCEVFTPPEPTTTIGGAANMGYELVEQPRPGGFDIVLANPPYGASVEDNVRAIYFHRGTDGAQSKDTYGLFMARALQLLRPGGQFSFIISDTWRTIRSHRPLRHRLLTQAAVAHVVDLPTWIFDATVNTCILTLTKATPARSHALIAADLRGIKPGDWQSLESNLRALAAHGPDVQTLSFARYTYPQSIIADYDNRSFFIGSPRLYNLMSDTRFVRLETVANVRQGLATADNEFYIRKRQGARGGYAILNESELLTEAEVSALSDDEKRNGVDPARYGGRCYVPYDKGGESDAEGGWMPNYHVPTGYFINWSSAAVHRLRTATIADVKRRKGELHKIKLSDETTRAAVIRNPDCYFREGVTFSRTGIYAPTYRLNSSSVFDTEGSSLFSSNVEPEVLLALMASTLARYIIKAIVDHTVHAQVDDLKEMRLAQPDEETRGQLSHLVEQIIEKQTTNPRYAYHLYEQQEIDALVYQLYGLDENDIREVELWYCRRYERLAGAQGVLARVAQEHADYLAWCEHIMEKPPGYWQSHPVYILIAQGENHLLDFKETLTVNTHTGQNSDDNGKSVIKAIAAFLNADGGKLLVGVADNGDVRGIARDLAFVNHRNNAGFEEKLRQMMETQLGLVSENLVQCRFESLPEGVVCVVDVQPRPAEITYVRPHDIYVRNGNRSPKLLEGRARDEWVARRSPR